MMNDSFTKYLEEIDMLFVYDDENKYEIVKDEGMDKYVVYKNGEFFDDRGELFASLRNVVVHSVPNVYFRSDPYIIMRD